MADVENKKFRVEKVVYYNSQKLWGVLGLTPIDDLGDIGKDLFNSYGSISASGSFEKPYEDTEVIITGDVIVNPQYGKQINVISLKIVCDTSSKEGIINYLARSSIEGIGVQLAEKIYDFFKEDTIDIVVNHTEELQRIHGIGKKTVEKVTRSVDFLKKYQQTIEYLTDMGIGYSTIMKLIEEFKEDTRAIIEADPYKILEVSKELSFRQVDELYIKSGGDPKGKKRLEIAFLYLLKQQATMEGSTGCLRSTLSKKFYSLLDIAGSEDFFGDTMEALEKENKIVLGSGIYVYYKEYLDIERSIAEKIKTIQKCYMPNSALKEKIIEEEIKDFPFTLNEQQIKAIHDCLNTNVAVLTGAAGCISGDTVVKYNRARTGRKGQIEKMYKGHKKIPFLGSNSGWDENIPTYVRSYIESEDRIKLNEVEDIIYSGKKEVWKLTLVDGKTLKATPNHEILTKKGFIPLCKLKKGDFVAVENFKWREKKEKSSRKPFKTQEVSVGSYHPYAKRTRVDGSIYYSLKIHRAIYEANLNGVSLEEFREKCKSPNNFKFIDPSVYHIHHIDHNHWNNDINNLTVMLRKDHYKEHSKGAYSHFEQGVLNYSPVVSIEYVGIEDAYDICCYENHNFVANSIVVHNCGKSSITKALYNIYLRSGFTVHLLSVTAKAAIRLAECTGGFAQTIHKFLLKGNDEKEYQKNTVLIIDEASMMDIMLFDKLLEKATLSTRILLVGDNNQLPSVQAGNVLGDTIDSGVVHVSLLTDIMRQKEDSHIIKYCSMINDGEVFEPCEENDFLYEEFGTARELKAKFLPLYKKEVKEFGLAEVHVITPYKKGEIGMNNLNSLLQQEMNGKTPEAMEGFRIGDKVRHTQNNYKKDVFNGETGIVYSFNSEEDILRVEYADKFVDYSRLDINELTLSYVSTVHASQGSEYKVVFVILDDTSVNSFLHIRRLLYTAVSRGKSKVYILTKPYLVDRCIENDTYRPRITKLREFLEGRKNV